MGEWTTGLGLGRRATERKGARGSNKKTFVIVLKTRELGQIVTTAECSTISRHEIAVLPVAIGCE